MVACVWGDRQWMVGLVLTAGNKANETSNSMLRVVKISLAIKFEALSGISEFRG